MIASLLGGAEAKRAQRQERHELRKNLAWMIGGLCLRTQKTISHGVEVQIESRLKCYKIKVNHKYTKPRCENAKALLENNKIWGQKCLMKKN